MEEVAYPAHEDGLDGMEEEEEDGEMEYGDEEMGSDHTSETSQDEDDDDEGDIDVISEGSHSQHWDADAPSEDDEEGDGEGDSVEGDDIEEGMDQDEALWEVNINISLIKWSPPHLLHRTTLRGSTTPSVM